MNALWTILLTAFIVKTGGESNDRPIIGKSFQKNLEPA